MARNNRDNREREYKGTRVVIRYPQPTGDADKDKEKKAKAFAKGVSKFKKMVQNEGIIQEYREKQFYEKPSDVRRRQKAMARKRWMKKQKELRQERGW